MQRQTSGNMGWIWKCWTDFMLFKKHLMSLANSMTCVGNLIGFNSDNYKNFISLFEYSSVIYWNNIIYTKKVLWESCREMLWQFLVKHSLHPVLGKNMWLSEQDYNLTSYGIRRRLDLIKQMDRMSKKPPVHDQQCWWNQI